MAPTQHVLLFSSDGPGLRPSLIALTNTRLQGFHILLTVEAVRPV